jgi:ATP synthase subunit 6
MFLFNFFIASPLEQFRILPTFSFFGIVGWTNYFFSMLVTTAVIYFLFSTFRIWLPFKKNLYYWGFFLFLSSVKNLLKEKMPLHSDKYFWLFTGVLMYILLSNLVGLLPWGFTTTSALVTTFFLSIFLQLTLKLEHFQTNGIQHKSLFIPDGTPSYVVPAMYLIELVSYAARLVSLAVRLFANIMAGHTLLHILVSVILAFFSFHVNNWIFLFLPWSVVFLITILETVIACMQAYVFIVLALLYSSDITGGH